MKFKHLEELPISSFQVSDNGEFRFNGLTLEILLPFEVKNRYLNLIIRFKKTLCHKHSTERFSKEGVGHCDMISLVEDSQWIRELRSYNPGDVDFWKLKHFAVMLKDLGLFQAIAQDYELVWEERVDE